MGYKPFIISLILSMLSWSVLSQNGQKRTGTVKSSDGQSLPGATVVNNSTAVATTTDLDGAFSIEAASKDVLQVSFIGFQQQSLTVGQQTVFSIVLQEQASSLDEVVITALGISKAEKKIGYATQKIETKNLETIKTPNLGSLFSGQVAGLEVSNPPGLMQAPKFSLRGKNPLVVIDGIPVETDFYDVSPEDIGDVNVLKGTTASALYGARGKNGAIMITTKNAKKEGLEVLVSQNLMVSSGFTVYPKTQMEYGNGSNGQYEFWDGKDGGINDGDMIWGPKFVPGRNIAQWNSPIRNKVTGETIDWWGNVEGTIYDDKSKYERVPTPWQSHDNLKEFMKMGIIYSSNFAVNYKGEKGSYRLSGDFTGNNDRVPESKLYRGGLSFKSTTNLSERLSLNTKFSYNKMYSPNYPNYEYNPGGHMYTVLIWMGADLDGKDMKNHLWVPGMEGYRQANWNYAWYNNPWFGTKNFRKVLDSDLLNGQMSLNYKFSDQLSVQARASGVLKKDNEQLMSPKSYFNYSASREGSYQITNTSRLNMDYDFLAMYDQDLSENIALNLNAGASVFYRKENSSFAATDGLTVPEIHNLSNSTGPVTAENALTEKAINSVYATLGLDFYNAFFFSLAARNDWSSTLAKANRSYFYPSASLSTVVSNLVELPSQIDYFKVYGSWARVSSDLDPYQLNAVYKNDGTFGANKKVIYPSDLVNPNILPETSTSFELGINLAFLKNRISFDATYYNVVDSDQIIKMPISNASGFTSRLVNGNKYTTNGLELSLGATPFKNEVFEWKTLVNWSTRVRKLTEIFEGADRYGNLRLNDRADSYYDTQWEKNPEGQLILDKNTGMPTAESFQTNLGHLEPSWTLGFNNNFSYANWTLSVGIDGIWGGVMRSEVVEKMWWGGKHPNSTAYRDEEYASGNYVYVPQGVNVIGGELVKDVNGEVLSDTRVYETHTTAMSWQSWAQNYPYRARVTESESKLFANIFDRTFIKLRTLSLGYDFTPHLTNKKIAQLSATLSGYNLAIWKKSKNLYSDPDFSTGTNNDIQDPSSRWIGLGVNVKF